MRIIVSTLFNNAFLKDLMCTEHVILNIRSKTCTLWTTAKACGFAGILYYDMNFSFVTIPVAFLCVQLSPEFILLSPSSASSNSGTGRYEPVTMLGKCKTGLYFYL